MKTLNIFFFIFCSIFLSGCIQTTSLLGPGVTVATTGNIFQAGFQYGANSVIKKETGKGFLSHIQDTVDEKNKKKKFHSKFKNMLENRIIATRQKLQNY
jgi:hypothetical protein